MFARMGISSVNVWINVWEIVFWWREYEWTRRGKESRPHEWEEEDNIKNCEYKKQMADDWNLFGFSKVWFKLIPIKTRRMSTGFAFYIKQMRSWRMFPKARSAKLLL